jgi:hypothetical protein
MVGSIIKKEVFHSWGYFDESFEAAGDTDFKMRVSLNLNLRFIDDFTGYYENDSTPRKTNSPVAELEDLRAWHLYRSTDYLCKVFRGNQYSENEILNFLKYSLSYKKTFCNHNSYDIVLTINILVAIIEIYPLSPYAKNHVRLLRHLKLIDKVIRLFDSLQLTYFSSFCNVILLFVAQVFLNRMDRKLKYLGPLLSQDFQIFSENRFEQSWKVF